MSAIDQANLWVLSQVAQSALDDFYFSTKTARDYHEQLDQKAREISWLAGTHSIPGVSALGIGSVLDDSGSESSETDSGLAEAIYFAPGFPDFAAMPAQVSGDQVQLCTLARSPDCSGVGFSPVSEQSIDSNGKGGLGGSDSRADAKASQFRRSTRKHTHTPDYEFPSPPSSPESDPDFTPHKQRPKGKARAKPKAKEFAGGKHKTNSRDSTSNWHIQTAAPRSTLSARKTIDYSVDRALLDSELRNQGRPYSALMTVLVTLADSKEQVLALTNKRSQPAQGCTRTIRFDDLVAAASKYGSGAVYLPRQSMPSGKQHKEERPLYSRVYDPEEGNTVTVYDHKHVRAALVREFGAYMSEDTPFHYVQVFRSSTVNDAPKELSQGLRVLKLATVPEPTNGINHDVHFLKKRICYPRYKSHMNLFIVRGAEPVQWFYTSQVLFDQEAEDGTMARARLHQGVKGFFGPEAVGYPKYQSDSVRDLAFRLKRAKTMSVSSLLT